MGRPGAVSFHASLRAAHDRRSFCHVQFLPITQQEGLALTVRQFLECFFNDFKRLGLLQLIGRRALRVGVGLHLQSFQRIVIVAFVAARERRNLRRPQRAHFLAPKIIAYRVLQYALNNIGSSVIGRAAYFSDNFIIASCTASSATCSSRAAKNACLYARRSTAARKSASSLRVASGVRLCDGTAQRRRITCYVSRFASGTQMIAPD